MKNQERVFGQKFDQAIAYATQIHSGQIRRKTGSPRIAHLLTVAGTVIEHGGDEEEAIAALLHDAVEDAGGEPRLADIRGHFGDRVADIVYGCTEPQKRRGIPWRQRKEAYLRHLFSQGPSVFLVAAADKLHNARALWREYRMRGESVWDAYRGGREGTLWYYLALLENFREAGPPGLVVELQEVIGRIEREVQNTAGALDNARGSPN